MRRPGCGPARIENLRQAPTPENPTRMRRAYRTQTRLGLPVSNPNRFARNFQDPAFPMKAVSYGAAKRAFDIVMTSAILLILWPVMLAIAIAI